MAEKSADQRPEAWGAIASSYEKSFEALSAQLAADALERLDLAPGERVLDVAAGTGAFTLLAARAGAEVLAADFSLPMIARLRERAVSSGLRGVSAAAMDGQALAAPDGAFDAAASILGLIFFPDIAKGIAEIRRVLRPGGRAALVCWGDLRKLEMMTRLLDAVRRVVPDFTPPAAPPAWARLAGAETLCAQMERAGFGEVEVATVTRRLPVTSPEEFWADFTRSVPPVAFLFERLGPERTEAVGRAFLASLDAEGNGGAPALSAEACIGVGRAAPPAR